MALLDSVMKFITLLLGDRTFAATVGISVAIAADSPKEKCLMRNIPVDPAVRIVVAGQATAATTDTGEARTDKSGRALVNLPVIAVLADGSAEPFSVRVPGPVASMPALTPVRLSGLVGRPWSMPATGRSGVSFSASAVEPIK